MGERGGGALQSRFPLKTVSDSGETHWVSASFSAQISLDRIGGADSVKVFSQ